MRAVDRYYRSLEKNQAAAPPPELIEVILWEKFHWTAEETDRTLYKKIQQAFAVLRQREISMSAHK